MSRLTARIRIVRMHGGRYKVEKIKVRDDQGDHIDVSNVAIKGELKFATKDEAREHGAQVVHAFITSKYSEGAKYQIEWKTRVDLRQEDVEKALNQ